MTRSWNWLTALAGLAQLARAEFGLAGQLFQLKGSSSVNNAKLAWASVAGASSYRIEQSSGSSGYQATDTVSGNTFDSYGLTVGSVYSFRVTALNGGNTVDTSAVISLATYASQGSYNTYDNTQVSSLRLKSNLEANGVYYRYNYETANNGSFSRFVEQTSTNGYDFSGDKTVLTGVTLCAPANYSCKLERISFQKNAGTGQFVMWAHYERSQDYNLGWVAVAHTEPGAETLTFDGAYRPNDQDSRDMAFFVDGNDAYLVTSTNTNTDNNIYRLTSNWTSVDSFLVQVNKGGHREAPAVIRSNGWYYLFTSRASGWLPSQPQFIAAQSMAGPWGSATNVGNTATFGAQSGGVSEIGSATFAMTSDRWSANWPTKGGPNRQLLLPLSLSAQDGFASYHYYKEVQYSDDVSTTGQSVYGVQSGKILSDGKPGSSSAGTKDIAFANDGIQTNPDATFVPSAVPFWYQIDLQEAHSISQIDLTTKMVQGSETFYRYNVTGSNDGNTFSLLADKRDSVDVGFSASFPTSSEKFRYVRINVDAVINNVNGNAASWAVGINEVTVYGN
ncbi:Putative coagulation factor 5/8 domain, Galactose-binding-like domain superfamily [Septoria linicola]|uniref:Coagulation factor 5/8 domain, Galactose-binding-like domain superfamily n=1 Tax=Septoria linicola TaxID=215465 RepID=A0A9Q9AX26_9PEZI|nr:putative coagulation factor 5/8 domain, Galactose-binding-like domain superfamily [Septoria linicola]USW53391.1 Putative coagulation factor 5/8 domain, Galactose-binding-like domain superfamily [Septoria linicola]